MAGSPLFIHLPLPIPHPPLPLHPPHATPPSLIRITCSRHMPAAPPSSLCRVKRIPSPIPDKKWYLRPPVIAAVGGLLPFGSIFIEMYFMCVLQVLLLLQNSVYCSLRCRLLQLRCCHLLLQPPLLLFGAAAAVICCVCVVSSSCRLGSHAASACALPCALLPCRCLRPRRHMAAGGGMCRGATAL